MYINRFIKTTCVYLILLVTLVYSKRTKTTTWQNHDFLTNFQLKRLIEENVLRKADIAKLPCVRHSRRCLVESIKERGWKNQQKLNKILNTILNIHNERKFIDQAVKLMIEDDSELLKGSRNDEDIIAQYTNKKKKSHKSKRSKITESGHHLDFLNTEETWNDFNQEPILVESRYDQNGFEEDPFLLFSSEENQNIRNLKSRKSTISDPSMGKSVFEIDNSVTMNEPSWRGDEKSDINDADFYGSEINSQLEFEKSQSRDAISDGNSPDDTGSVLQGKIREDENGAKRDMTGVKKQYEPPPYDMAFVPTLMRARTNEALQDLKSAAFNHMAKMLDANLTKTGEIIKKKKPRKLTKLEKVKLDHKMKQQRFTQLYKVDMHKYPASRNQDGVGSGLEELDRQEESDFQESMKNLEDGWDLDFEAENERSEEEELNNMDINNAGPTQQQIPSSMMSQPQPQMMTVAYNPTTMQMVNIMPQPSGGGYMVMQPSVPSSITPTGKAKKQKNKSTKKPAMNSGKATKITKIQKKKVMPEHNTAKKKHTTATSQQPIPHPSVITTEKLKPAVTKSSKTDKKPTFTTETKKVDIKASELKKQQKLSPVADKKIENKAIETKTKSNDSSSSKKIKNKAIERKKEQNVSPTVDKKIKSKAIEANKFNTKQKVKTDSPAKKQDQHLKTKPDKSIQNLIDKLDASEKSPDDKVSLLSNSAAGPMTPTKPATNKTQHRQEIKHEEQQSLGLVSTNQQNVVPDGDIKASRVCKPGVMKTYFEGKPNCLVIGDSIALGYSYSAAAALNGSCQVQLAPSSKAGAAMDSSYGRQCLDYFLSTISLRPTQYDVILFNFGLHDIDYLDKYPEEASNITDYVNNLEDIKRRLLDTGATVGFVLSTPVTYDKRKDDMIRRYNHAAKKVMETGEDKIMTINLHKIVTRECGPVPFENCYMMKKPHDVHYGVTGSIMLGKRVASAISYLLKKRKFKRSWTALTPSSVELASNKTLCAVPGTACPVNSVCMNNMVSRSGHGCCQLSGGVDCGDSWHCCPAGSFCHPKCSDTKCSCMSGNAYQSMMSNGGYSPQAQTMLPGSADTAYPYGYAKRKF
ncbi:myb-like protein V [Clytia hemisphaerica]|uniref:Granulins domain-containing protein n=1 Tax=Clytia hemisphaerica TaxID=252671 RepID=A0A7M5TVG7_9CNID